MWLWIGALAVGAYLLYRNRDGVAAAGFVPGPGDPAAAAKAAVGAMVGVSLVARTGGATIAPAHVTADRGASVEVFFDVADPEIVPTPDALRGARAVVPKSSLVWAVFAP